MGTPVDCCKPWWFEIFPALPLTSLSLLASAIDIYGCIHIRFNLFVRSLILASSRPKIIISQPTLPKLFEMTDEEKPTANMDSLFHHVEYGAKGTPPTNRVVASDWGEDIGPLLKPEGAEWNQAVPHEDIEKLLNGFMPLDMDDKWFVYTTGPDTDGQAVIHFHRSWTGYKIFEATLMVPLQETGEYAKPGAHFSNIAWTTDKKSYAAEMNSEKAKKNVTEIFNWCMDVVLP
jgi:hypothetical protein